MKLYLWVQPIRTTVLLSSLYLNFLIGGGIKI
nr:MAG TPA: hypothetical protein [Caudoviricetes sp.]